MQLAQVRREAAQVGDGLRPGLLRGCVDLLLELRLGLGDLRLEGPELLPDLDS